ncbi:hypothetical protein QTL95_17450 [Rhizobium sp. S152]|uniref:hypothetical protein n=1 Tax=Rhizobium sp. S152 TaxID=3055038 RepID=UPI0025A9EB32|nr:hypothetical protein [Rhizobium sp. S152]MDM9627687.1 hypothetical protein [Rhizobium sp. S152]
MKNIVTVSAAIGLSAAAAFAQSKTSSTSRNQTGCEGHPSGGSDVTASVDESQVHLHDPSAPSHVLSTTGQVVQLTGAGLDPRLTSTRPRRRLRESKRNVSAIAKSNQ